MIEREPDWELLRAGTPANLVRLLRRCLTKDPKLRLRDIGEARIALEQDYGHCGSGAAFRRKRRVAAIAAILGTVALASQSPSPSTVRRVRVRTASPSPVRFEVPPPEGTVFDRPSWANVLRVVAGRIAVGVCRRTGSASASSSVEAASGFVAMADLEARPLPGTDGATSVFWSPDGRSLAFFADGKLKRIDLPDGAAVTICDARRAAFSARHLGSRGRHPHRRRPTERRSTLSRPAGGTPREILPSESIEGRSARALAVVPPGRQALPLHGAPRRWRGGAATRRLRLDDAKGTRDPFSLTASRGRS